MQKQHLNGQMPDNKKGPIIEERASKRRTVGGKAVGVTALPLIEICIINASEQSAIAKRKTLNGSGSIITETEGNLQQGTAENALFSSMAELAQFLDIADFNTVITASTHTATAPRVDLVTKAQYERENRPAGKITRSKQHLIHASGKGGILTIDCDDKGLPKTELIRRVKSVIPSLDTAGTIYTTSASSHIYNGATGEELAGVRGQRLYIRIQDQADIKRAGQALIDRLWLAGFGYYEVSSAGAALERTLADKSLFNPTHLDFIGGSKCLAPLEQRRPAPDFSEGDALDTLEALPDLTDDELLELQTVKARALELIQPELLLKREQYVDRQARANLSKQGVTIPTLEELTNAQANVRRAVEGGLLTGEQLITLEGGDVVTVGEILRDPMQYDGARCLDPIEPDYDGGGRYVGKIHLHGRKNIYSFAHGGRTFYMIPQPSRIEHHSGQTAGTTRDTLELLRALPDYFDLGDQLVKVTDGHVMPLNNDLLGFELGLVAQFTKATAAGKQANIDAPEKVVKQITAHKKHRDLKQLNAVITAPTITAAGHVITKRGHDTATGLYLSMIEEATAPAPFLTIDDAKAAYVELMKPFDTFNYSGPLDRSVALSAVLTAIVRPTLSKAPGVAIDAPKQGSGKTYLCQCLALLGSGEAPAITPTIQGNEDEIRKVLLSMLIKGARNIVWDNVIGQFSSATIAAMLTADMMGGRVLGASDYIEVPNRALFLVTGNNIDFVGDMPRRFITCRLDTKTENPIDAQRDLTAIHGRKPDDYITDNRQALVKAAVTLISAYLQSNEAAAGGMTEPLAGFDDWDRLARQPILWLSKHLDNGTLTDPKLSIDASMQKDPEAEELAQLLNFIYSVFEGDTFTAGDLYKAAILDPDTFGLLEDISTRKLTSRSVGNILKYRRDRIAGGFRLILTRADNNGNQYKVQKV